jgi:hypothetical protein
MTLVEIKRKIFSAIILCLILSAVKLPIFEKFFDQGAGLPFFFN